MSQTSDPEHGMVTIYIGRPKLWLPYRVILQPYIVTNIQQNGRQQIK